MEKIAGENHGWKQWKVTLPQPFRMHWLEDVVYSQEWRELLKDFDQRLPDNDFMTLVVTFDYHLTSCHYPCHFPSWVMSRELPEILHVPFLLPGLVLTSQRLRAWLTPRCHCSPWRQPAHHGKVSPKQFQISLILILKFGGHHKQSQ